MKHIFESCTFLKSKRMVKIGIFRVKQCHLLIGSSLMMLVGGIEDMLTEGRMQNPSGGKSLSFPHCRESALDLGLFLPSFS